MNDQPMHYDIIADVHGRYDKLEPLLLKMGYQHDGVSFVPPAGHKALFLGDLIDPKPGHPQPGGVRKVLHAVKAMQERGHALAIMGNHELNAICYHTNGPNGEPLRFQGSKNQRTHQGTLDDFPDHKDPASEWQQVWMPWMKAMPLYLDLGVFRAIHACWHPAYFEILEGKSLSDDEFLVACADKNRPEGEAIEVLLKGIEVPLPDPHFFEDHAGNKRKNFRARWWEMPGDDVMCHNLVFPANEQIPEIPVAPEARGIFSPYPSDAPPVFFGHYFKPANTKPEPERPNVACLDHSAAIGGPLVAYRWKGEARINPANYISHS
jgi:hypothetical protein